MSPFFANILLLGNVPLKCPIKLDAVGQLRDFGFLKIVAKRLFSRVTSVNDGVIITTDRNKLC